MTEPELKTKKERLCVIKEMESVKENRASMSFLNGVNKLFNFGNVMSTITFAGTIPAGVYSDSAYVATMSAALISAAIVIPGSFITQQMLVSRRTSQIKYEQEFISKFGDQYDVSLSRTRYYPTNIKKMQDVNIFKTMGTMCCASASLYAAALMPLSFVITSFGALVGAAFYMKGNAKSNLIFTGEMSRMMQNLKTRRIKSEMALLNDEKYTVESSEIAERRLQEKLNELNKTEIPDKTKNVVDLAEEVPEKEVPKKRIEKKLAIDDFEIPSLDDDDVVTIAETNNNSAIETIADKESLKNKLDDRRINTEPPPLPKQNLLTL